jgi:chorismate mutase
MEIAKLKRQQGAPILDRERERAVVNRACAANTGPLQRGAVARIFRALMRESRMIQLKAAKHSTASGSERLRS